MVRNDGFGRLAYGDCGLGRFWVGTTRDTRDKPMDIAFEVSRLGSAGGFPESEGELI
jgi:hypothetical protein